MKIATTGNKGIHIIRDDGVTFSIQFGGGNYCENYRDNILDQAVQKSDVESKDCEVAVWVDEDHWITNLVFPENGEPGQT